MENLFNDYGISFPRRILYAFHTSFKIANWSTLTVLAGVSSTGKSELPRLYSAFGGFNFITVPVQPNWDSQDETTKSLSDKVLDRGIVINFPRPRELKSRKGARPLEIFCGNKDIVPMNIKLWDSWREKSIKLQGDQLKQLESYRHLLEDMNEHLSHAGRAIGHRVWQSIEHYVINYSTVRDEEKRGFVGLTEIINAENFFKGDELTRIATSTLDAVRHISNNFREKIIREKLSSTNNLLAVRRRMSLDTGENRLYLAFLRQMEEYIEQKRLANPKLLAEAERDFQQLALKILHDDELDAVGRWENMSPNNTLLSDRFYRQIWRGWNDLQKLSEMLKADSEHLGERLCTAYFFKLLSALGRREKFPQQPIKYDYAKFEVQPLRGNSIVGESLRLTKFEMRLEIRRGEKIFGVAFEDITQIFSEGATELLIYRRNFLLP